MQKTNIQKITAKEEKKRFEGATNFPIEENSRMQKQNS
jgi:hypothetical protein